MQTCLGSDLKKLQKMIGEVKKISTERVKEMEIRDQYRLLMVMHAEISNGVEES